MNGYSPLLTDLYQLTMMQSYYDHGLCDEAVFEFFVRKLPESRSYLIACGLEQVLDYLAQLHFSREEIAYLRHDGRFHEEFLNYLQNLRFTGSVHGMAEGTPFFTDEPVLRVTAPLPVAQLVETRIINILQFQSMVASKAARMRLAAPGKILVDYGLRRAHGAEAGVMAARASYLAGFDGTATVMAGKLFAIPLFGTMAHSYIQAHDAELDAFRHFAASHPENTVLLLDTYDTEKAAARVVRLAPELAQRGVTLRGVRLDSGDMIALSHRVRKILDDGGLQQLPIFASGSLDENVIRQFITENAPVDGFGIGSKLTTCADTPYFDCAYKLVEYSGLGRRKLSTAKITWPGRKQVYRQFDEHGCIARDILALADETHPGVPLIHPVMKDGQRLADLPSLNEARDYLNVQYTTLAKVVDNRDRVFTATPSEQLRHYGNTVTARVQADND